MNYTHIPTKELVNLIEKACWYADARKTGTPDAILVALADDVIRATASYIGELWKPVGGDYEEGILHKG